MGWDLRGDPRSSQAGGWRRLSKQLLSVTNAIEAGTSRSGPVAGHRLGALEGGGGTSAHRNTARQAMDGLWTEACGQQKQSNDPRNNQHNPQYANYWAPLTRKRHSPPHPAQPRHTNDWAPRTRKRHQQEHRPQRPTERSDPTQHAKGRTGDCPGPRKGTTTRRNVTRGGVPPPPANAAPLFRAAQVH